MIYSIKGFTEIQKYTTRKFLALNYMLNQVNDAYESMIRGVFRTEAKTISFSKNSSILLNINVSNSLLNIERIEIGL